MALTKKYTTKGTCNVTFTLPQEAAPEAKQVRILGEFNDWSWKKGRKMRLIKGVYTGKLELPAGKSYEFRYQIDESSWENDWAADGYSPSSFPGISNSVVDVSQNKRTRPAKPGRKKKAPDLTVIEGVGPKIKKLLADGGFASFADVAKADPADLKSVLDAAGPRYRVHNPGSWPQQAQLAADGKWDELKKLQDSLKGGK